MKKLMRTIALTLAAVLVLGITVFAASPTTGGDDALNTRIAKDGIEINWSLQGPDGVKINPLNRWWFERACEFAATQENIGDVLTVFDITATQTNFSIKFSYNELQKGQKYALLHYNSATWQDTSTYDIKNWEIIYVDYDDVKTITAQIGNTSPFAIAVVTGSGAVVAPKTGEVIALSAILALIMMAGAVVCAKKARLQK